MKKIILTLSILAMSLVASETVHYDTNTESDNVVHYDKRVLTTTTITTNHPLGK